MVQLGWEQQNRRFLDELWPHALKQAVLIGVGSWTVVMGSLWRHIMVF